MLAIVPFLIFAISLASLLPLRTEDVLIAIKPYVPSGSYDLIRENLEGLIGGRKKKLASISLLAAFWVASMAVQSLVRAMNDAYRIVRKEGVLVAFLRDLLLTAGLMVTLAFSLLIPIGEEIARVLTVSSSHLPGNLYSWWLVAKWAFSSVYLFFFFLFVYKIVPSGKIRSLSVVPGAVFATTGWQLASVGYSYYVTLADYTRIYGQLGSIVVLMIWFYLTAAVLLIGGLINAAFIERRYCKSPAARP